MAKTEKRQAPSQQTRDEALKIARATQRPGQTKEQTKLIAQGIQKGIDQYKKQQKAKARELDRHLKKVTRQAAQPLQENESKTASPATAPTENTSVPTRVNWLPWGLLVLSWLGFLAYSLL